MNGTLTLLNIAGAVALLLFAVRMVRTGVDRAYGTNLRRGLQRAATGRAGAAVAGAAMAVGLQGSTAVALLITGAAASGLVAPPIGLSVLLGADLGSALVVQVLSFDLSILIPVFLLVGVSIFLGSQRRSARQAGRIIIGIALILTALQMIAAASEPLRASSAVAVLTSYLAGDPITAFLLAALLTWLLHSGVAAVLIIASFAAHGVLPVGLGIVLVLGVNLGSGIIAVILTKDHERDVWVIPIANFAVRASLAIICLVLVSIFEPVIYLPDLPANAIVITTHIFFNLIVVLLCLPFARTIIALVNALLPRRYEPGSDGTHLELEHRSSLDPDMVSEPKQAIANAVREILTMSNTVSAMLQGVLDVFKNGDKAAITQIAELDDTVDGQHAKIKHYLTQLGRQKLSKDEARRCSDLMTFCVRLEQAADVIVKNLLSLARKKQAQDLTFSKQGWHELTDLHECVSSNLQRALNVLVSADPESARALIEEKQIVRQLEQSSTARHMERLRKGTVKSVETSEIHLDAVRDFVQINTLVTSVAYPILEHSGELLDSRLASAGS